MMRNLILKLFGHSDDTKVESLLGAGYYPMPTKSLMRVMSKIDPRHTYFIKIKVRI